MRKIYESQADKERQARVGTYLTEVWDCGFVSAPDLSFVDGKLVDLEGKPIALVEIKTRKNSSTKYPTYMLSAHKWRNALQMAKDHGVPFMLIVEFTNGIFAAKLKDDYPIARGGRTDRNDAMDVEDCIYIPMSEFKELK